MLTVRNPTEARALTVRAKVDLEVGMIVKLVQGVAPGDPCQVDKVTAQDLADPTVVKGIVDYIPDNDLAVDVIVNPTNSSFTRNTGEDNTFMIPAGAQCVFWYNKPILGFHSFAVDAGLDFNDVREGDAVAFKAASGKLALYDNVAQDGTENFMGIVYRHEGPELTVLLTAL